VTVSGPARETSVGGRRLGAGNVFVLAEAGINHDGDMKKAHRLIEAAHAARADGIKFQNYRTEDFVTDQTLTYEYGTDRRRRTQTQYEMFKEREIPREALPELRAHAAELGIAFVSTPTSEQGIQDLVDVRADAVKNGSDYLVHLPLVRAMARSGLPTILSTGMSTTAEIDDALRAFDDAGGEHVVVLHCTSRYPTPPNDANLLRIRSLAAAFGRPTGFSDHTEGTTASVAATVLGAVMIEKHFTLDRHDDGPDHWFSADPAQLDELVQAVRDASAMLGDPAIRPTDEEAASRADFRLSCVAAEDLAAGTVLTSANIMFTRPGTGLPPKNADLLIGRRLATPVSRGTPILADQLD